MSAAVTAVRSLLQNVDSCPWRVLPVLHHREVRAEGCRLVPHIVQRRLQSLQRSFDVGVGIQRLRINAKAVRIDAYAFDIELAATSLVELHRQIIAVQQVNAVVSRALW